MNTVQSHSHGRMPDGPSHRKRLSLTGQGASVAVAVLTGVLALGSSLLKIAGVEKIAPEYVTSLVIPSVLLTLGILLGIYFGSQREN